MSRTWTYTGNISSYSSSRNIRGEQVIDEIVLGDLYEDNKAPVLLHVSPSLMAYIMDIEWNDDEERYMRKEFVYDNILCIREIRILNKEGDVCKIIREADMMNWTAEIAGPVVRIKDENQKFLGFDRTFLLVAPETFKQ